ncbi:hypothetical protein I5535_12815 [Rhodobacteraceae bacterium F11138]|nr:hypothetical protein [Rhodobacteraceae bacterium F11138]
MSQIEELHGRITAAMERIGNGVSVLAERPVAAGPDPAMVQALEEEQLANAQLQERLRSLKARHDEEMAAIQAELENSTQVQALRDELAAQNDTLRRLDQEVQRLRAANDQLRQSNAALRTANENGLGDPELINTAMRAELEGLRAARATEVAEIGAVLAKLEPLLAGTAETGLKEEV